jgi:tetratricopeptide (TPR) repeat protein
VFRQFFIIISVSFFCIGNLYAQNLDQTLALADKMYGMQQYEPALKHYHRVAFFADDSLRATVYPQMAACYFHNGDFRNSIFYYDLAANSTANDSLANEYLFARILCFYMLEQYDFALQYLYSFQTSESSYFRQRYHFYNAIISMKKGLPDEALSSFLELVDEPEAKAALEKEFSRVNLNSPNPTVATILSIILPGAGQLYAGDYSNAANSFMLNGLLIGLTYVIAINYSVIDATMSTASWMQRYYMGGFTRAGHIATRRKQEKREQLLDRTLGIIELYNED